MTAPPFGGRPLAAWLAELRRRREEILGALANDQRTTLARKNEP